MRLVRDRKALLDLAQADRKAEQDERIMPRHGPETLARLEQQAKRLRRLQRLQRGWAVLLVLAPHLQEKSSELKFIMRQRIVQSASLWVAPKLQNMYR